MLSWRLAHRALGGWNSDLVAESLLANHLKSSHFAASKLVQIRSNSLLTHVVTTSARDHNQCVLLLMADRAALGHQPPPASPLLFMYGTPSFCDGVPYISSYKKV